MTLSVPPDASARSTGPGLKGTLSVEEYTTKVAPSWGETYPAALAKYGNMDYVSIAFATDAVRAAALIPKELELITIPGLPGQAGANLVFAKYRECSLGLDFKSDGPELGKGGTGVLSVDGQEVDRKSIDHGTPVTFPEDESFDVGRDTRTGVALLEYRYDPPFKFTGNVNKVTFDLKPEQTAENDSKVGGSVDNVAHAKDQVIPPR